MEDPQLGLGSSRWRLGLAFIVLGTAADAAAGAFALGGSYGAAFLLHVPAALVWASGVTVADLALRLPSQASSAVHHVQGRVAPVLVLLPASLLLYPGLVATATSLGLLLLWLMRGGFTEAPLEVQERTPMPSWQETTPQKRRASTASATDDIAHKRRMIRNARVDRGPDTVKLLRDLLSDRDLDVRTEAAVALCRLDSEAHRSIVDAIQAIRVEKGSPELYATLAVAYQRYANAGLLDCPTAVVYLRKASEALKAGLLLAPGRSDLQRALNDVEQHLGAEVGHR